MRTDREQAQMYTRGSGNGYLAMHIERVTSGELDA